MAVLHHSFDTLAQFVKQLLQLVNLLRIALVPLLYALHRFVKLHYAFEVRILLHLRNHILSQTYSHRAMSYTFGQTDASPTYQLA